MKKLLIMLVVAALTVGAYAQQKDEKSDKSTSKAAKSELKDHVCTAACKDGKHVYAHGEKGHTCTDACKGMKK
jgi:hypothetical protein